MKLKIGNERFRPSFKFLWHTYTLPYEPFIYLRQFLDILDKYLSDIIERFAIIDCKLLGNYFKFDPLGNKLF